MIYTIDYCLFQNGSNILFSVCGVKEKNSYNTLNGCLVVASKLPEDDKKRVKISIWDGWNQVSVPFVTSDRVHLQSDMNPTRGK